MINVGGGGGRSDFMETVHLVGPYAETAYDAAHCMDMSHACTHMVPIIGETSLFFPKYVMGGRHIIYVL